MSRVADFSIAFVLAAVVAAAASARLRRRIRPPVTNHRGRRIPAVLGIALTWAVVATVGVALLRTTVTGASAGPWIRTMAMLGGMAMVFLAGRYDDRRPDRTRGVAAQLRRLTRGEITPGAVKLAAAVAGAALAVGAVEGWGLRSAVAIPTMAGAANLWNLLDVRPGRSLKFFLPVGAALALAPYRPAFDAVDHGLLAAALGAAVGILPTDLSERAVLGDAGANVLGFLVGLGLLATLPTAGLVVALAIIVALHVASETVTLSLLIRSTPPVRWFDDLGTTLGPKSTPPPVPSASMKSRSD